MKPILFVAGTRPELLKILPVVDALRKKNPSFCKLYFTNQHDFMAKCVFRDFQMQADYLEKIPRGGELSLRYGRLFSRCRRFIGKGDYAAVCVQGDTLSAFVGALSGFLLGLPVCHIEAGLRTYVPRSPFPEEMNRRAVTAMADFHFCSTESARDNLLREGVDPQTVAIVGNTGEDALRRFLGCPLPFPKTGKPRILLTLHRRENSEEDFRLLLAALANGTARGAYEVIFPVHGSPRMEAIAAAFAKTDGFRFTPPLSPALFYPTLCSADLVLTDSGGVSEESAVLGIPTLVFRRETERTQELSHGRLSLFDREKDFEEEIRRGFSLPRHMPRFHLPSPSAAVAKRLTARFFP